MGIYGFRLPDIGEGVVEGEVVAWHVEVGASVNEDDPLVDVMTDKANVTIPSPVTGTVTKTVGGPGDIIAVGSVCIEFEVEGEGNASPVTKIRFPSQRPSRSRNRSPNLSQLPSQQRLLHLHQRLHRHQPSAQGGRLHHQRFAGERGRKVSHSTRFRELAPRVGYLTTTSMLI